MMTKAIDHWVDRTAEDLRQLGLQTGDMVLVHSSLSSLGHVPGGPESVVRALLDALGPSGTLLMPGLSYATVDASQPLFNLQQTPCCVGAIPEYFRTRAGTLRSLHPTHSVCGVGPEAEAMLVGHDRDDTPCGPSSPFRKLREHGGKILMLGCGLRPNTSMHGVEELAQPLYLFGSGTTYRLTDASGNEKTYRCHRHGFIGWEQRYDRLEGLLDSSAHQCGRIQKATADLLDAPSVWEAGLEAMQRDPFYFVARR